MKEKSCRKAKLCITNKPSHQAKKSSIDKNKIFDIALLADEFWNNVEEEKKKTKKATKPRATTPLIGKEKPAKVKESTIRRGSKQRFQNKYFHEKFKETMAKKPIKRRQNSVGGYSKTKREPSTTQNKLVHKVIANKRPKKIVKKVYIRNSYSPIQISSPRNEKKVVQKFNDQQIDFEPISTALYIDNKSVPKENQNDDSTLQLIVDDKETYNIHPRDEEGLIEGRYGN